MSDQMPIRAHQFERNPLSPEECRLCGGAFEDHPHKFNPREPLVFSGIIDEVVCFECMVCGHSQNNSIHDKR